MIRFAIMSSVLLNVTFTYAGIVVGAFDSTRTLDYSIKSQGFADQITSNIVGSSFVEAPTLTDSFLSSIDVLMLSSNTSFVQSTTLSPSEQAALISFVSHGGGVVDVAFYDQSFWEPFGVQISANSGSTPNSSTIPDYLNNPISNGPFGTTSGFTTNYLGGDNDFFASIGPYATAIGFNYYGLPTLAYIPENSISNGSGRVVLFADPETAVESIAIHNGLALNAIAYVAVPEVSTVVMNLIVAMLGVGYCLLRKRFAI